MVGDLHDAVKRGDLAAIKALLAADRTLANARLAAVRRPAVLARHVVLALLVATAGCVSGPEFEEPEAPGPGETLVYLYRVDTWPVQRNDAEFSIDGAPVATLRANSFTWLRLPAGRHRLSQVWDMVHVPPAMHHNFSAPAGTTHYLRLNVEMGTLQLQWRLSSVREAEAKRELAKCSYVAAPKP